MANDLVAGNVRVAVTGAVYVAPVGTAAPVDADTALNAAFKSLGYLSEDGVSIPRTVETSDIKAWQNSDVVRSSVTSDKFEVKFTMIETNDVTMGLFWGKTIAAAANARTRSVGTPA